MAWGIGDGIAAQAAVSRLLYGMARDEQLPKFLGWVHPKYKTPWIAILLVACITLPIAVLLPLEELSSLVNFGALTAFMILHITVIGYYYFKQKERSGKAILNYLALPLIGLVIIAFVWINLNPSARILGFVWLGIGLVILAIVSRGFRRIPPTLQV